MATQQETEQRCGAPKPRYAFKKETAPKAPTSQGCKERFSPANPNSVGECGKAFVMISHTNPPAPTIIGHRKGDSQEGRRL